MIGFGDLGFEHPQAPALPAANGLVGSVSIAAVAGVRVGVE